MGAMARKQFAAADERRPFVSHGYMDLVKLGEVTVGRGTFEPGWRWSEHVKPLAATELCEATHTGIMITGRMQVRMRDGQELALEPGDVVRIPPGHDAWVLGEETCVMLDFTGMGTYAAGLRRPERQPEAPIE